METLVVADYPIEPVTASSAWAANNPRTVALCQAIVDDIATSAWTSDDPTVTLSGPDTVTPDTASASFFCGGEGVPVSATGEDITPADTVRGGPSPLVFITRPSLFPTELPLLVTGLKDDLDANVRTITGESF